MILRELGILAMFKLLFDLYLVIIWLFNLFFKCDGEEAHVLFKILCKLDVSGFWIDYIYWWLCILDTCYLLILLSAWIVSVLDIISGCDYDIILFPTFFSQLLCSIEGEMCILFANVLILLFYISFNIEYFSNIMESFLAL